MSCSCLWRWTVGDGNQGQVRSGQVRPGRSRSRQVESSRVRNHVPAPQTRLRRIFSPSFVSPLWRAKDWQAGSLYNAGPSDDASTKVPGLPVWAVPAQASRAEGDEPIVTVDAGSHVRPVGSACVCDPTPGPRRQRGPQTGCQAMEHPGPVTGGRWGRAWRGGTPVKLSALWGGTLRRSEQASQAYRISTLPAATLGTCADLPSLWATDSHRVPSSQPSASLPLISPSADTVSPALGPARVLCETRVLPSSVPSFGGTLDLSVTQSVRSLSQVSLAVPFCRFCFGPVCAPWPVVYHRTISPQHHICTPDQPIGCPQSPVNLGDSCHHRPLSPHRRHR